VQSAQGINPRGVTEADVIALYMEGGQACVQVFFIRAGQNWGNKDYYPRVGRDVEAAEVLEAFLGQFYDHKDPPRQVILSHPIENADLMADGAGPEAAGCKVEILVPQRGEKAELVNGSAEERPRKPRAARWRRGRRRRSCCAGWRRRSNSTPRRAGSRSTTTPTFRAPMRWAR
jgi:excinuclease ABC subunit C